MALVSSLGVDGLGAGDLPLAQQMDTAQWPVLRERLAALFRTRRRDEWVAFFAGHEVCFAPVLEHARGAPPPTQRGPRTFTTVEGVEQPAPAPRFSRTPGAIANPPRPAAPTPSAPSPTGASRRDEIATLLADGVIASAPTPET